MKNNVKQLSLTSLHLAAGGVIAPLLLSLMFGLLGLGVGLLFVLGVGVVVLAGLAFSFRGVSAFERRRVAALYNRPLDDAGMRRSRRRDGWRFVLTPLVQFADGANWKAMLHLVIVAVLGTLSLGALQLGVSGVFALFSPLQNRETLTVWGMDFAVTPFIGLLIGIGMLLIAIALIVAFAYVQRAASISLLSRDREQQLEEEVRDAGRRRTVAVRGAATERDRIERDLHDSVQPRLVSIGMTLGMAKQKLNSDPARAAELIDEAHASTKDAVTELRQLARGFQPAVLTDRGLDAALSGLAARSHIPVVLDAQLPGRCSKDAEAAVYFAVAESLGNAAKHSGASEISVQVRMRGSMLWARIQDDGHGGARLVPGGGLDGVTDRIEAAGGAIMISSPPEGPTTIEVSVPCAS
ncbi:sensor histidine kinase [Pseudoclavibacter sp. VKM Ac-2888]|uniref:sensor histidine kinase n=1 Tax=Pseudoclavibacter sp. VKM Ac-2888 TaxID=2783830 RepID=UPI00188B4D8C|nr:sensor histidine kinase [Pseudoclavibacter sp. VKM Ac-2888]MBF4551913.1 sensor histidine kinase [Pseudoclavibacter sp. VKM Ac-2888]